MDIDKHRYKGKVSGAVAAGFFLGENSIGHKNRPGAWYVFVSLRVCVVILALSITLAAQTKDYARWVDPFIGTGGHGHTFPGATMPFGMVQLSPDTRVDNWDGSGGYHYSDDLIYGFSHTHLSGTGIPDYCDILFMPTLGVDVKAGPGEKDVNGYASRFAHASERAEPGYYRVMLEDDQILAEMAATRRVGVHRYTFPKGKDGNVVIDLNWRDKLLDSTIKVNGPNRIEGFRRSSSWAKDQVVYFSAAFSIPFDTKVMQVREDKNVLALLSFDTSASQQLIVKVGISPVSIEGARNNLMTEVEDWDFDKVRADARAEWNKELGKIEVSGGTDGQTKTFYTALYHTMIQPNIAQDVDGGYRGADGKAHRVNEGQFRPMGGIMDKRLMKPGLIDGSAFPSRHYTVFSLWDTFRAAHPLYTIIDQKRTVDFINTFIRQYEQGGRLPVWELAANETDTMIGYHAVSVIADAMIKGIEGFDYEKAYAAAKHSADLDHFGLAAYKRRGYISMEDEQESVSKTLEYAYNDWCISRMAHVLERRKFSKKFGLSDVQEGSVYLRDRLRFESRARYFENHFDPETGFMRPRQNGGFVQPFAPNEVTFHFTEGNSWVYSFFVPQDVPRLMAMYGGPGNFSKKLDSLFTTTDKLAGRDQPDITGLIGQYAHGNEPSHHIAYLYVYAGQPWRTQEIVRRIMDEFYKPSPDGLIGNEDCGQMSAWYVMSALGFYQVAPGDPMYAVGTPLFKEAKVRLENGKVLTIKAPQASPTNKYVRSVKVNGRELDRALIYHNDITSGSVVEFQMAGKPDKTAMADYFRRGDVLREHDSFVAVPLIEGGKRTFRGTMSVALKTITPDTRIFYTLDGSEPTAKSFLFDRPVTIAATTDLKALAMNDQGDVSKTVEATFNRIPNDWSIKLASKYNRQYTGGGDEGLMDGIRGTTNFASGEWQGYQGQDLVATIDLRRETEIERVGAGFLQVARSWIWMPTHIEFEVSSDGINFKKVADIKTDIAADDLTPSIRDYAEKISPITARYVRIRAVNLGKIPAWHPGAGGDAFIFVDEIIID